MEKVARSGASAGGSGVTVPDAATLAGELDSAAQQVGDNLRQAHAVSHQEVGQPRVAVEGERDVLFGGVYSDGFTQGRHGLAQREGLLVQHQLARFDAGHVEHIVDEGQQVGRGRADAVEAVGLFFLAAGALGYLGHPDDGVEGVRSSWLMRERNSLLTRLALSATMRAFCRRVMSVSTMVLLMISPNSSRVTRYKMSKVALPSCRVARRPLKSCLSSPGGRALALIWMRVLMCSPTRAPGQVLSATGLASSTQLSALVTSTGKLRAEKRYSDTL